MEGVENVEGRVENVEGREEVEGESGQEEAGESLLPDGSSEKKK